MEENKIPTWEEMESSGEYDDYESMARVFAKLHVVAALKAASENARCCDDAIVDLGHTIVEAYVEPDSILNAYPLDLIK